MKTAWLHHSDDAYPALCGWLSKRVWGKAQPMPDGTAMMVGDARIKAAVLFNNYQPNAGTIELTAASDDPRWLSRATLWQMFDYAFNQLKCQAAVLRVDPANVRMNRIAKAYGFTDHTIPRLRGRDKAETIYILGDNVWRANGFHKENAHG